jgi:hypothetical protein
MITIKVLKTWANCVDYVYDNIKGTSSELLDIIRELETKKIVDVKGHVIVYDEYNLLD